MQTVSIVGVGLIGASFGLALRAAGFTGSILGVSSEGSVRSGVQVGAIDAGTSLENAAAISDLIYLSQPIEQILITLERLGPIARRECLITDAGSTKEVIVATARKHLEKALFVGGHPMAGKEQRGAEAAEASLFRGKPYVLMNCLPDRRLTNLRFWLENMGARLVDMDPREHDRTVALTSHLPQLLSTALASMLGDQPGTNVRQVFGSGLLDMTRLALSAPEVWASVLDTNSDAIDKALSIFEDKIKHLRVRLQTREVLPVFDEARQFAQKIRYPTAPN